MTSDLLSEFFLFFCEDAASGADGKLNARGIYNELYAPGFPAQQDRLMLAGIIEWQREVTGDQPFEISILDPEGKPIFSIEGNTAVDARSDDRPPARTHLVFPLENLVFVDAGRYRVQLRLADGEFAGPSLHLLKSGLE